MAERVYQFGGKPINEYTDEELEAAIAKLRAVRSTAPADRPRKAPGTYKRKETIEEKLKDVPEI